MNLYLAEINLGVSYADIFMIKAKNKKEAKEKVYNYCKDEWNYKMKDIVVYTIDEYYKDNNAEDTIVMIH